MNSFYSYEELLRIGFKYIGKGVLISKKASLYSVKDISIGDNVRIDDFCILSGKITIGNNIHIAPYSGLFGGKEGIIIQDYANVSSRVCIYALSDDFSGCSMTNPMIPEKYKNVHNELVVIGRHVIIGTGSTILPGTNIGEGSAIGAMSLVNSALDGWTIYAGIPVKKLKQRSKNILKIEKEFENNNEKSTS